MGIDNLCIRLTITLHMIRSSESIWCALRLTLYIPLTHDTREAAEYAKNRLPFSNPSIRAFPYGLRVKLKSCLAQQRQRAKTIRKGWLECRTQASDRRVLRPSAPLPSTPPPRVAMHRC